MTVKASYRSGHVNKEPVTCLGTDRQGELVVVGGGRGTVTVFEILSPEQDKSRQGLLLPLSQWVAHHRRVHSIDIIEHARLLDAFVLVCCIDAVTVWTLGGSCVGRFGQVRSRALRC